MMQANSTFFWQIILPGSSHVSYLLGTMHVRDERAFRYWTEACKAIDQCQLVALETNIEQLKTQDLESRLMIGGDRALYDYLKPSEYLKIKRYFERITGKPLSAVERMHPIFAEGMLSAALMENQRPFALDEALYMYAQRKGKPLTGIEPIAFHVSVLDKLEPAMAARNLYKSVKNIGAFRKKLNRMADLYAAGEMQKLNTALLRQSGNMRRVMIYERNEHMAVAIANLARDTSVFCAVGAGHLAGSQGILRMLKHEGFQLNPLTCPE